MRVPSDLTRHNDISNARMICDSNFFKLPPPSERSCSKQSDLSDSIFFWRYT